MDRREAESDTFWLNSSMASESSSISVIPSRLRRITRFGLLSRSFCARLVTGLVIILAARRMLAIRGPGKYRATAGWSAAASRRRPADPGDRQAGQHPLVVFERRVGIVKKASAWRSGRRCPGRRCRAKRRYRRRYGRCWPKRRRAGFLELHEQGSRFSQRARRYRPCRPSGRRSGRPADTRRGYPPEVRPTAAISVNSQWKFPPPEPRSGFRPRKAGEGE